MSVSVSHNVKVDLVSNIGDDALICKAARVSTLGTESLPTGESAGLISFLMRNRHGSPFEHNQMTFLIHAPIFVFREFHRHRIGWSYNEESGRYKTLDGLFYMPDNYRPILQEGKPGEYQFREGSLSQHHLLDRTLTNAYAAAYTAYKQLLNNGIAKEVARMCLPVGMFSSMYATCNARSLMNFLELRTKDDRAQRPSGPMYEIEQVARQMEYHFADLFPHTYDAWNNSGRIAP